jgi:putative nucleotidyltransferase with HDIG domain
MSERMNIASLPVPPLQQRFVEYAQSFAAPDGHLNPMMQLKLDHSLRVRAECRGVAAELGWSSTDQDLADAAGLLHDVGRFEQCRRFHTFADARSVDHGDLGVEILAQTALLDDLAAGPAGLLREAVRCHNKHEIPAALAAPARALVQLVRDVDKLDIMTLIEQSVRSGAYARDPGILLHVTADGPPSADLLAEVRAGRTGSYAHVRTLADIRLVGVSWTRDIVCLPVLSRLRQRGLTDDLARTLEGHPEAHALAVQMLQQMTGRLERPAALVVPPGPSVA